jgi:hypothetical protein
MKKGPKGMFKIYVYTYIYIIGKRGKRPHIQAYRPNGMKKKII